MLRKRVFADAKSQEYFDIHPLPELLCRSFQHGRLGCFFRCNKWKAWFWTWRLVEIHQTVTNYSPQ